MPNVTYSPSNLDPNSREWHEANMNAWIVSFMATITMHYLENKDFDSDFARRVRKEAEFQLARMLRSANQFPEGTHGMAEAIRMIADEVKQF